MSNIGRGWSFPPRFNKEDSQVEMTSTDQEEVEQALRVLFSTRDNERLFHPDYGCSVEKYKFQTLNSIQLGRIRKSLEEAIDDYEPRITVESLSVDDSRINEGILMISLDYTINESGSTHNMVYPFNFE